MNSSNIKVARVLQSTCETRGQCASEQVAISCAVADAFSGLFLSRLCFPLHLFVSEWTNNVRRILHIFVAISLKSSVATRALEKLWRGTGRC